MAAEIPIRTHVRRYPLEAANEALADLKHDRVRGAAVLAIGPEAGARQARPRLVQGVVAS